MKATLELATLREQLLSTAFQAREDRIDQNVKAHSKGKAKVEAILEDLRSLYRKDDTIFDTRVLDDVRTAKVCVGIITRTDLEQAADEVRRKAITAAHKLFLKKQRIGYKGARPGFGKQRATVCASCQQPLDNAVDIECAICFSIICPCGACGCVKEKKA